MFHFATVGFEIIFMHIRNPFSRGTVSYPENGYGSLTPQNQSRVYQTSCELKSEVGMQLTSDINEE